MWNCIERSSMEGNGELESPLLLTNYREGCPGCKIDMKKATTEGLPMKELIFVALLVLCNSLPISSLFPFIYFMVRDFHIAKPEDIGYYAGFMGSSFMLGRFLTSVLWGIAADKYGRKPIMIISVISVILFNTLFGLSCNFWMAVSTRFLLGCFNGLLGPIKAYASEVCKEEHQAIGLSTVGTSWGIGLVIGPALGGFLAQPTEKYPNWFSQSSFFGRFPYFLPCICITAISVLVLVTTLWLPETLHNHPLDNEEKYENDVDPVKKIKLNAQVEKSKSSLKENLMSLLRNRPAMSSINIYCILSLVDIAYSEIFSLWAVSPRKYGGLNYTTSDVGTILATAGFGLLLFQAFIFPPLANAAGPISITRIPLMLTIPLLVLHPFIGLLSGVILWIAISTAVLLRNVFSIAANTGTFLLLNNSVSQHQRGVANGVALTGMSLFKTIGPSAAGAIFAWAQKRQEAKFLPGMQLVYFAIAIVACIIVLMTYEPFLPKTIDKSSKENTESKC